MIQFPVYDVFSFYSASHVEGDGGLTSISVPTSLIDMYGSDLVLSGVAGESYGSFVVRDEEISLIRW